MNSKPKHETSIDWTHVPGFTGATWNPFTGCSKVSAACANCYAERLVNTRQSVNPKSARFGHEFGEVMFHPERVDLPLRKKKGRAFFVCSMSDLFHELNHFEDIAAVLGVMAATPHHRYFVLTKRPKRMLEFFEWISRIVDQFPNKREKELLHIQNLLDFAAMYVGSNWDSKTINTDAWPLPNVAFGVTAEDQKTADERIPLLLKAKWQGWIKYAYISAEPLVGAVDLDQPEGLGCHCEYTDRCSGSSDCGRLIYPKLDWVIAGGESGPEARPGNPDWYRSLRDQCEAAGVPFHFKQWGEWLPSTDAIIRSEIGTHLHRKEFAIVDGGYMRRVGKKAARDLLDGKQHKGFIKSFAEDGLGSSSAGIEQVEFFG